MRLIQQIITVTGMEDCNSIAMPVDIKMLGKDENGDPPMKQ